MTGLDSPEARAPHPAVLARIPGRRAERTEERFSAILVRALHSSVSYVEVMVPQDLALPAQVDVELAGPVREGWAPKDARQFGQAGYRDAGGQSTPPIANGYPLDESVRTRFARGVAQAQKQAMQVVAFTWPMIHLTGFWDPPDARVLYLAPDGAHHLAPLWFEQERPSLVGTDPFGARHSLWFET